MKVAVECKSPLLQKSLELFLTSRLSSLKQCDIVIRDKECANDQRCLYVSSGANADLIKPFSKAQLIMALEKKYHKLTFQEAQEKKKEIEPMNFDILEKRIEFLTREYQTNIIRAVRAFYEE